MLEYYRTFARYCLSIHKVIRYRACPNTMGCTQNAIREGLAEILRTDDSPKTQAVFYNPIQQYNRDLSVLAIRAFAEDFEFVRNARQQRWRENKQRGKKRKRGPDHEEQTKNGPSTEPEGEEATHAAQNGKDMPARNEGQRSIPPLRILDALSASGLRALRYGKELPFPTHITANDLSPSATKAIKLNVERNALQDKIQISTGDAVDHMHHSASDAARQGGPGARLYHVIDLDPYGTAAPFLDAAVRTLVDGGLLCVTCTDAGVFASTGYLEKTYSQYGGLPLKGPHAHEGGLRLILNCIATAASRYGIAIEPLLSLSIDFYARIFVRIHKSPAEVKFLASKTMLVYNCDAGCGAWSTQYLANAKGKENKNGETIYKHSPAVGPTANMLCEHCGFKAHVAGPMWGGPLHNTHFIERILETLPSLDKKVYGTIPRIEGMLTIALDEALDVRAQPGKADYKARTNTDPTGSAPKDEDGNNPIAASVPDKSNGAPTQRPVPPLDPATRAHFPFFIVPPSLSRIIHCETPSDPALRGALLGLGYRTSRSHTKPGSIVTDAPWAVIWEIMREWVRQKSPVKADAIRDGTAGKGIMSHDRSKSTLRDIRGTLKEALECKEEAKMKEKLQALLYRMGRKPEVDVPKEAAETADGAPGDAEEVAQDYGLVDVSKLDVVFDEELGKRAQGQKMVSYQQNPQPDWGPMSKAKTNGSR